MELFRALAVLAEPPTVKAERVAELLELGLLPSADEYTELFVFQLYPYASVYLGTEGMMGGEARDRIAGFWRALGQSPPAEPDHLSVMLALYARLAEIENDESDAVRREGWRNARRAFLWEHLLSWLLVYLTKLSDIGPRFYTDWGLMLFRAVMNEAATLGYQEQLPVHLRDTPGLIDPRGSSAEEFFQSVLVPARSGMILTRSDLTRAARELGLGLRRGERLFILKSLFAQDAQGILGWLLGESATWLRHHRVTQAGMLGEIAGAWERRTQASAALLEELKLSAAEVI